MTTTRKTRQAEVLREYGPYPGIVQVHGVTFDGARVWFARGESIVALDPAGGALVREVAVAADAGTAFDGEHLWQLAGDRIQKVDPRSGGVVATIPAPAHGRDSGLTWAEGTLWVGEYRARKIHQIDAETGAILRTIESDRFVTGVSWVSGELWHATMEDEHSDLRRVDPETGEVLERLEMPAGVVVSGLEADGAGVFYCGGGASGKVRAVRKP
jgi:glutamine cyclotransferase